MYLNYIFLNLQNDIKEVDTDDEDGEGDLDEVRKGDTGKTFTLTGVSGDIVEPFEEDEVMVDRREVVVSPVSTPLLFRPMTSQTRRLTLRESRDRLLEGDITVPLAPTANVMRVYMQSAFIGKYPVSLNVGPDLQQRTLLTGTDEGIWAIKEVIGYF